MADEPGRDDIAIDEDGKPLPLTGPEVRKMVMKMIDEGEIMAVVVRVRDSLAVQVFGPPSLEMLEVLERTTRGYRRALRGH